MFPWVETTRNCFLDIEPLLIEGFFCIQSSIIMNCIKIVNVLLGMPAYIILISTFFIFMIPTSQEQDLASIFPKLKLFLLSWQLITGIPGSVPTISCLHCLTLSQHHRSRSYYHRHNSLAPSSSCHCPGQLKAIITMRTVPSTALLSSKL